MSKVNYHWIKWLNILLSKKNKNKLHSYYNIIKNYLKEELDNLLNLITFKRNKPNLN